MHPKALFILGGYEVSLFLCLEVAKFCWGRLLETSNRSHEFWFQILFLFFLFLRVQNLLKSFKLEMLEDGIGDNWRRLGMKKLCWMGRIDCKKIKKKLEWLQKSNQMSIMSIIALLNQVIHGQYQNWHQLGQNVAKKKLPLIGYWKNGGMFSITCFYTALHFAYLLGISIAINWSFWRKKNILNLKTETSFFKKDKLCFSSSNYICSWVETAVVQNQCVWMWKKICFKER